MIEKALYAVAVLAIAIPLGRLAWTIVGQVFFRTPASHFVVKDSEGKVVADLSVDSVQAMPLEELKALHERVRADERIQLRPAA